MVFSETTFAQLQYNTFQKTNVTRTYCIYNEPTTRFQPTNKTPIKDANSYVYTQGKIKANSPNQSKKLEYAAYARRFGKSMVIGPC
jgi:hypothetical protein